jgi:hypothetical protein
VPRRRVDHQSISISKLLLSFLFLNIFIKKEQNQYKQTSKKTKYLKVIIHETTTGVQEEVAVDLYPALDLDQQ